MNIEQPLWQTRKISEIIGTIIDTSTKEERRSSKHKIWHYMMLTLFP